MKRGEVALGNSRLMLAATALLATACGTSPAPVPRPMIAAQPEPIVRELEDAQRQIEARAWAPQAVRADIESAATIPMVVRTPAFVRPLAQ